MGPKNKVLISLDRGKKIRSRACTGKRSDLKSTCRNVRNAILVKMSYLLEIEEEKILPFSSLGFLLRMCSRKIVI